MRAYLAAASAALLLSACAYTAKTEPAPSFDVYSNYGDKIPGSYLLYVDAEKLDAIVHPTTFVCGAYTFPIAMAEGFKTSIQATLANVVGSVELVPEPVSADALKAKGARGMIVVRGEDLTGHLDIVPGFWSATMSTEVSMVAGITVDGRAGRLLGETVEGSGKGEAPSGFACSGGAKAFEISSAEALKETVRKLGEALSNAARVRAGT